MNVHSNTFSLSVSFSFFIFSFFYFTVLSGDIADTLLDELLDIKEVFSRIDSTKLSSILSPKLFYEIDSILKKEGKTTTKNCRFNNKNRWNSKNDY